MFFDFNNYWNVKENRTMLINSAVGRDKLITSVSFAVIKLSSYYIISLYCDVIKSTQQQKTSLNNYSYY